MGSIDTSCVLSYNQGAVDGWRLKPALQSHIRPVYVPEPSLKAADHGLVPSPAALRHEIPLLAALKATVLAGRKEASDIVHGRDPLGRLLVVVGPCSIHDPVQALEYCDRLLEVRERYKDALLLVMRCYLEKPRTVTGWKGLFVDPDLDGSSDLAKGLRMGRALLAEVTARGLPVAGEMLSLVAARYVEDIVSVGFVGARTTESQLHRELASASAFPVGFKNGTDGSLTGAVNAVRAAAEPHKFLSIGENGAAAVLDTQGNQDCFVVLRGGSRGTNYDAKSTMAAEKVLEAAAAGESRSSSKGIMIDCSHGNAEGNHENQILVAEALAEQMASGRSGITGVMLESHINGGKQKLETDGAAALQYGVSITDACISWEQTTAVFDLLAEAVRARRSHSSDQ
ncbi:3-deoxy-7-phosphoheptulonate synthase [Microdochium nivale]|nr:3-deoxy-7-phosphoheptulonate synthase [Microdochium nivale]